MDLRFITKRIHAYLDYPVALSLIAAPFLLGLGSSHPLARWLAFGTGIAALVLTLFTEHHLGAIRVLPYKLHLAVDFLVGVTFLVAPAVFGFSGVDAWYYWANAGAVLAVVSLHSPDDEEVTANAKQAQAA